jgi:DNA-binding NtrC family response regulator
VVNLHLPPLRERKGDILLLANYFLKYFCEKYKKPMKIFSPKVLSLFMDYHWPGNIRELKNLIERLVIFSTKEEITEKDLLLAEFEPLVKEKRTEELTKELVTSNGEEIVPVEEIEKQYIIKVLKQLNWNKSLAAKKLGIDRKTLTLKLKKWGYDKQLF